MKRRSVQTREHAFEGINATPLIDVVMCLITFFLLVGKLAADRGAELRLPETRVGDVEKAADVLVITVGAKEPASPPGAKSQLSRWPAGVPRVGLDDRPMPSPGALEIVVRTRLAERPRSVVQVRAQRDLAYGQVQPVLAALARAGATTVRLAMERAQ